MFEQVEDKKARNIIIGLIAGGGLLGFLGLTLPYQVIHYVEFNRPWIFDAFSLSYIESIPQAIGNMIAITTSFYLFSYCENIPSEEETAKKKYERLVFFAVSSLICTILGLLFTVYYFLTGILRSYTSGSGETLYLGIGFYLSVIGPLLVFVGVYNLVKLRKRLFLP